MKDMCTYNIVSYAVQGYLCGCSPHIHNLGKCCRSPYVAKSCLPRVVSSYGIFVGVPTIIIQYGTGITMDLVGIYV